MIENEVIFFFRTSRPGASPIMGGAFKLAGEDKHPTDENKETGVWV
jgi:hypothetical protein